jgi:hypothetical protein
MYVHAAQRVQPLGHVNVAVFAGQSKRVVFMCVDIHLADVALHPLHNCQLACAACILKACLTKISVGRVD